MASSAASASGGSPGLPPTLRRLPWPRVAPVDLATEFPWLILHESAAQEWDSHDHEPQALKATVVPSVYAQPLRAPRASPVEPSPAQRAARMMLQLQDEMERHEHHVRRVGKATTTPTKPVVLRTPVATFKKETKTFTHKKKAPGPTAVASPPARLQQWLARQRLPNESVEATAYSVEMETRIYHKTHATLGAGLWKDEVASPIAAELCGESVFGGFVATRRLAFVPPVATTESETTSPPLEPMDDRGAISESVTISMISSPTPDQQSVSMIQQFASDARGEARAHAASGDVPEALATLQHAIDRVQLEFQDNQDELRTHGFDFAPLAHAMARRLQYKYKRRHHRRVVSLVVLQRAWRRARLCRAFSVHHTWRTTHATVIQRAFRHHANHQRRVLGALRIQRCFRIFQCQKLLQWLHRACRLLTIDFRRARALLIATRKKRRRLWVRLTVVLIMLQMLQRRRRAVVQVQSQWRGHGARQQYAKTLRRITELEARRRDGEDAFVESRRAQARQALHQFYEETACGQKLVAWRLRAPWLRWRRLKAETTTTRTHATRMEMAATLQAMYVQRDGIGDIVLRGVEARCVGVVLGLRQATSILNFRDMGTLDVSTSETQPVVHSVDTPYGPRWSYVRMATLWTRWWTQRRTQWTTQQRAAARAIHSVLWTYVVFPKLVLETSVLFRARRQHAREAAIKTLLDDHDRVLRVVLRCAFRSMEQNPPKYECPWCGAGIATAAMFYAHRHAAGTGCVELEQKAQRERAAIAADIRYHQWWNRFGINKKNCSVAVSVPTAFAEDAPYVRRVAARGRWHPIHNRSRDRAALGCLVDAAQCCGPTADDLIVAQIPAALLAQLVWLLDDTSGHSLERIHVVIHCDAQSKADVWIRADEAAYALGLAARPHPQQPLRTAVWTRAWQRLRAMWTSRRDRVAAARYHVGSHGDGEGQDSNYRWGRWRQRIMARVVASA